MVRLNPRYRNGCTLLHLCVNSSTPVDTFHTSDIVRFPCALAAKLLVEAGADVATADAAPHGGVAGLDGNVADAPGPVEHAYEATSQERRMGRFCCMGSLSPLSPQEGEEFRYAALASPG